MNSLLKITTITFALLFVTGCASTDPNAPIDDDYNTSYYWTKHRSTALNLLTSANMQVKYDDVSSKEDVKDIRDRNTTLGNLTGNLLNLAAFDVGMLAYSVSQNDDDYDPRYTAVTYVAYIPVNSDDLSPAEQLTVRESAVSNVEKVLVSIGSDKSKLKELHKKNGNLFYRTKINGEICEATKHVYEGTGLLSCYMTVMPKIVKVLETEELPDYMTKKIKKPYVASVTLTLTNPLVAVEMLKGLKGNDFIAFPDTYGHSAFQIAPSAPIVVQDGVINSFFTPRKNISPYANNELSLAIYFKKTKRLFKMPITTGEEPPVVTEVPMKK